MLDDQIKAWRAEPPGAKQLNELMRYGYAKPLKNRGEALDVLYELRKIGRQHYGDPEVKRSHVQLTADEYAAATDRYNQLKGLERWKN